MKIWVLQYHHRHGDDLSAYPSEQEALVAASIIAMSYAKECDADVHAKLLALAAEPDKDLEIVDLYNQNMDGDEWLEIHQLDMRSVGVGEGAGPVSHSSNEDDRLPVECPICGHIEMHTHPDEEDEKDAQKGEQARLIAELEALPAYRGWCFAYEYPGFFCFHHPDGVRSVFFTPDWNDDGMLPIEVQDDVGTNVDSVLIPLPREGRTGQQLFDLVKSTLDKHQPQPESE